MVFMDDAWKQVFFAKGINSAEKFLDKRIPVGK